MKIYNGLSPNGLRVAAFIHEKGINIPVVKIDVMKGETRAAAHLQRNTLGEIPVLELDDGTYISESIAICRYLESLYPETALFGNNAVDAAKIEMWNRRMEQQIMGPCAQFGLHVIPIFADKIEQMPDYADTQKRLLVQKWQWLESELADGREFIAGPQFSIADITGMAALMICGFLDALQMPEGLPHVVEWANRMQKRPSFSSLS
jgi:glutathione S-transferase